MSSKSKSGVPAGTSPAANEPQAKPRKFTEADFPPGASATEKLMIMKGIDMPAYIVTTTGLTAADMANALPQLKLVHTTREEDGKGKAPKYTESEHLDRALKLVQHEVLEARPNPIKPDKSQLGKISQSVINLIKYSDERIVHFGRAEREGGIGKAINDRLSELSMLTNQITIFNPSYDREGALRQCCALIRSMNDYIEAAFYRKLIEAHHFDAWVNLTVPLDNLMLGMAIYLQEQRKGKKK